MNITLPFSTTQLKSGARKLPRHRALFILFWSLLISLIITRVYLAEGVPITHDGENHLARFANYKVALKEGQVPPRFAPNLYHRHGYPVFTYNYPLANIMSVPFSLLKLPYYLTLKLLMIGSLVAAVVAVWIWLSQLKYTTWSKMAGTAALVTTPYLFQSVVFRGSIGEVMAMALFVWMLVWVESLALSDANAQKKSAASHALFTRYTLIGGALFGLFFLSHNVTVLFGTPVLLAYAGWRLQLQKRLWTLCYSFLLGIGASLWFWLPALLEQDVIIVGGSSLAQQYQAHFATLQQLLSSPVQFGYSYLGQVDSLSFGIGLAQVFVILSAAALVVVRWKKNAEPKKIAVRPIIVPVLIASLACIVLQLQLSAPLWQLVPLARYIQFPWRLGFFVAIGGTLLTAWVIEQGVRWQRLIFLALLTIQVALLLGVKPIGYIKKERIEYELFEQSTTTSNENLPKSFTYQEFSNWKPAPLIESGDGKITILSWTGSQREYQLSATTPMTIIEPTMYFPGWVTQVRTDPSATMSTASYINSETIRGRIAYQLQAGTHTIKTSFTRATLPRKVGDSVSALTLIFMLIQAIRLRRTYGKA